MKMQSLARFITGTVFFLLISAGLLAQTDSSKVLPAITVTGSKVTVNDQVWKAFQGYFKDAQDLRWYKIDRDYLAKFIMEDQEQSALFNKRGSLVYHITYGTEKNLPADIRQQVRSVYYDYTISKALSIREANRVIWVLNLEDAKSMLVVRVEEGEMEEAKRYKKSL
jgi:hypothetical protein